MPHTTPGFASVVTQSPRNVCSLVRTGEWMFRSNVVKTGRVLDGVAIELEALLNHDRRVG